MPRYRIHFEASAAIGIEVEIDGDDEQSAQELAEQQFDNRLLNDIADHLLYPSANAVALYAQTTKLPITYVTVETDEAGFEVVDAFPTPASPES